MSLTQLKDEAANLLPGEQRELIAFLIARRTESDQSFKDVLARKIDDRDGANWIALEELQRRYSE